MRFHELNLPGAYLIKSERFADDRGYFERTFCANEFEQAGLPGQFVQHNISFSIQTGTLRGLHFQVAPHTEAKIVRVNRGRIFDVIVDLRPGSPSFAKWTSVEMTADGTALFVPEGFAHGLQTLEANTEVFYLMSQFYSPDASRSLRFDDPDLGIRWPLPVTAISEKDRSAPRLKEIEC